MSLLWQNTSKMPKFPRLENNIKTDVLIIGGGITGILCAYLLKQSGVECTLVEANTIFSGVSGKTTAKITSQHGLIYHKLIKTFDVETAKKYYCANEDALKKYRTLCKNIDCDFEDKDNYVYSTNDIEELQKELDALKNIGAKADFVSELDLSFETLGGIKFPNQAQFNPAKFISYISKELNIYEHTAIRSFNGTDYCSDFGNITAEKVIVATHFPFINKHGSYFLKLYQHRSYVLALENAANVDGMYVDRSNTGLSFRNYGDLLLLGGGGHRTGQKGGGWNELEDVVQKCYPNVKIKYRFATQDCMTLDNLPYIGQYSKNTPDLFVATGFNKWGMTLSMVSALILCDLVQEKSNINSDIVSPSRTMLHPQLAVNTFHALTNIVKFKKPRCPHMGCALNWNKQERTWDCPCHGSRFSEEGKLLDNPATGDLK